MMSSEYLDVILSQNVPPFWYVPIVASLVISIHALETIRSSSGVKVVDRVDPFFTDDDAALDLFDPFFPVDGSVAD